MSTAIDQAHLQQLEIAKRQDRLERILCEPIKAITLWQPWATLMALQEKRIETRSWATRYRGPIAIHASKHTPPAAYNPALNDVWFQSTLNEHGVSFADLPRSRVLCIVDLIGCFRTTELHKVEFIMGEKMGRREFAFGNYALGRWAWVTRFVGIVDDAGPTQGGQGLWDWLRGPKSERTRQAIADGAHARGETTL